MKSTKCYPCLSVFLFLMFSGFFAVAESPFIEGKSKTLLGDYLVKESQPVVIDGQSFRAYELSYANSGNPILIYIDERDNCRDYIVRSRHIEIKYVCRKAGFGVEPVLGKHMKYDSVINNFLMNPITYKAQINLTPGNRSEKEALELIAINFPKLPKNISLLK